MLYYQARLWDTLKTIRYDTISMLCSPHRDRRCEATDFIAHDSPENHDGRSDAVAVPELTCLMLVDASKCRTLPPAGCQSLSGEPK